MGGRISRPLLQQFWKQASLLSLSSGLTFHTALAPFLKVLQINQYTHFPTETLRQVSAVSPPVLTGPSRQTPASQGPTPHSHKNSLSPWSQPPPLWDSSRQQADPSSSGSQALHLTGILAGQPHKFGVLAPYPSKDFISSEAHLPNSSQTPGVSAPALSHGVG